MNLRDLEYVIAVAELRNFTRAAKATAVSQPALSNQIKKLEAEFGTAIFERTRTGVDLTPFGEDLIARAVQITALVDDIGELAKRHQRKTEAPIRIGMTPTLAAYLSFYFRDLLATAAPGRRVVIVEEYPVALADLVEDRSIDFAFIARKSFDHIYSGARKPLEFRTLWLEPVYLAVRTGHALTRRTSIWAHDVPEDQLLRFPISFGYDLEHALPEPSADRIAETTGIDISTARFETVCRHVAQSDACTIVNAIAAEQFRSDGFGLSFIPFDDEGNVRELGAICRADYSAPSILRALGTAICNAPPRGTIASCAADMVTAPTAG